LPAIALQPPVDPAPWDAKHELPEAELLRREPPSLVLLDPTFDRLVAGPGAKPLDCLPRAGGENTADDLVAVMVPPEGAGTGIPEKSPDGRRKEIRRWVRGGHDQPILCPEPQEIPTPRVSVADCRGSHPQRSRL
jgi:hypothetical protein